MIEKVKKALAASKAEYTHKSTITKKERKRRTKLKKEAKRSRARNRR